MSTVSQLPSTSERKERRRLHLREVAQKSEGSHSEGPHSGAPHSEAAHSEAPPAFSIGATLRAARVERGEEPSTIASALKMRADQLEAIENNDFSRLPGRTYVIGFVRAYAQHLGLDAEALIQKFKDESASQELNKPVELVFPEALEEQRLPNGSILIVALVIAMVIYGVSYLTMPNRKAPATAKADEPAVVIVQPGSTPPESMTSVVSAPAPESNTSSNATTQSTAEGISASGGTVVPPTTFVAGSATLPPPSLPAAMAPVESPRDALDGASLLPPATLIVAQATAPEQAIGVQSPAANGSADAGSRITLKALQPTYIQIKDPRQPGAKGILVDRVLNPGESYQAPDRIGLVMQTGNAGGLQVEVDGRNIGVLGKSGEVITRIPVDPSYFLERLAASQ